jgi:hypothetical protein
MLKAMKLSKIYSFKKPKSHKIISFTFPFIDAHSKIRRGKRQHQNSLFALKGRLFPSEIRKKRPEYDNFGLFLQPSLYTKNHRIILKALIFSQN